MPWKYNRTFRLNLKFCCWAKESTKLRSQIFLTSLFHHFRRGHISAWWRYKERWVSSRTLRLLSEYFDEENSGLSRGQELEEVDLVSNEVRVIIFLLLWGKKRWEEWRLSKLVHVWSLGRGNIWKQFFLYVPHLLSSYTINFILLKHATQCF